MVNATKLGCSKGDVWVLGEGDEAGGRYLTLPNLSTQGDTLAMLNLHIRAQEIWAAPDE